MLALSIAVTALSDLTTVGQNTAVPENANGFLALLNAGNGNDSLAGNNGEMGNDGGGNGPAVNNQPPVNVPTSVFAENNPQNTQAPAPQALPQQTAQPSAGNQAESNTDNQTNSQAGNAAGNQTNSQTQNSSTPSSQAPQNAASSSNGADQDASASASGQPSAQQTAGQAGGNAILSAKQLRSQIKGQLNDISQLLLSMIQALSASAPQQLQQTAVNTPGTAAAPQAGATGNSAPGSTDNGQQAGTDAGSQAGQEIGLLEDMQSLLQQMQQALAGQGGEGQGNQNTVQTLSDSLLSDMGKLSQMMNPPASSGDSNASSSPLSTTQFSDLGAMLKNSIAQIKGQLQTLQTANETIFAQAASGFQSAPSVTDVTGQSKTAQNNNSLPANTAATQVVTDNAPAAPIAPQDITAKPDGNGLPFAPPPLAQANVSQGGGSSTDGGNQDFSQNQATQPAVPAAPSSSPSSSAAAGSASFARVLNQVSQSDVLNQIQFQVKTALGDGSSKITIQLNPPDLGKVDVKLDVSADGKASGITITATNQNTLDLLQRDPQGLTRALNAAGLTTDSGSLSFSLGGGGQQNQAQTGNQQAATIYQQAQPDDDNPSVSAITRSYVVNLAEGLDITI